MIPYLCQMILQNIQMMLYLGKGFKIYFNKEDIPNPVITYEIIQKKALGGIDITTSHNINNYNKLSFHHLGADLYKTTKQIKRIYQEILKLNYIIFEEGVKLYLIKF